LPLIAPSFVSTAAASHVPANLSIGFTALADALALADAVELAALEAVLEDATELAETLADAVELAAALEAADALAADELDDLPHATSERHATMRHATAMAAANLER